MRRAHAFATVVAVGCLAVAAVGAAEEFNMAVTTADIQLGQHIAGPAVTRESLAHRVVLLEFWGVHCPPCLASMPKLEEAHKSLSPTGLVVIGAHSQGGDAETVRKTAADLGVTFTIVDQSSVNKGSDFNGIPHCMLFDHTGKCVYRGSPFEAHEAIVKAVEAAPSAILAGRKLEKLAYFNDLLRDEAAFGPALRKAKPLVSSKDAATADEAKFVVERLEERGKKMLEDGLAMKESNPLGAVELVQRASVAFKGADVGTEATTTLRDWRKDKSFQTAVKAAQQLAKLQLLRAEVLRSFGDDPNGEITADMVAAIPQPMKRKMAEVIRGIQKTAPGSETAKTAAELAEEFDLDIAETP